MIHVLAEAERSIKSAVEDNTILDGVNPKKGGIIMPELRCSVHTCVHNKNQLCDLDSIQVAGSSAQRADETSCASFSEKKGDSYSNKTGTASPMSNVDCKAVECQYNESCKCHAGKISVGGNDACHYEETKCASFEKRV